ncbi:hypothetical protein HDU93_009667 [Gonapodya sp. JEL0774]|nr:hypothetical protein HDU93_009667 [Gonapodya sp. JEL0774]
MGKAKNSKKNARTGNTVLPTQGISADDTATAITRSERTLPIVSKLQSANANDRAWAAASCAHLASDKALRKTLLDQNVIGWLIQCLSDSVKEVRVEAAGALQNLSSVEESELDSTPTAGAPTAGSNPVQPNTTGGNVKETICAEMYRKDIFTPIMIIIREIHSSLKSARDHLANVVESSKKDKPSKQQTNSEVATGPPIPEVELPTVTTISLAENLVSLIWNLSEGSDKALKAVSASPECISFLVDVFEFGQVVVPDSGKKAGSNLPLIGFGLVKASANCLASVSEDNHSIENLFKARQQWFSSLGNWARGNVTIYEGTTSPESIKEVAVLTCCKNCILFLVVGLLTKSELHFLFRDLKAILYNVRKAVPSSGHSELLNLIVSTSFHCVDFSLAAASAALTESPIPSTSTPATAPSPAETRKHSDTTQWSPIAAQLRAAHCALELISNVCSSKDVPLTTAAPTTAGVAEDADSGWQDMDQEFAGADEEEEADDTMEVEGDVATTVEDATVDPDADGDDDAMAEEANADEDIFADEDDNADSPASRRLYAGDPRFLALVKVSIVETLFRHCRDLALSHAVTPTASIPSPPASDSGVVGRTEVDESASLKEQATRDIQALPGRVLAALANVFLVASWSWIREHDVDITQLWSTIWAIARNEVERGNHNVDTIESSVAAICVVMEKVLESRKKLKDAAPTTLAVALPFTLSEVELLVRIFGGVSSLPLILADRADAIRCKCLSTLTLMSGPILLHSSERTDPDVIQINRTAGDLVMSVIEHFSVPGADWSLEVLAEGLDFVFDVYGDVSYRYDKPVFVNLGYLNRLRTVFGPLRKKVKSVDKRNARLREARFRADGALINLNAFIKYKEKELKASSQ